MIHVTLNSRSDLIYLKLRINLNQIQSSLTSQKYCQPTSRDKRRSRHQSMGDNHTIEKLYGPLMKSAKT